MSAARVARGPRRSWRVARVLGGLVAALLLGGAAAYGQTPPSNLTATAVSSSQIDLAWTGSGSPATYNVYRDGVQIASGLVSESYSDTGLAAFTEYEYYVTSTVFGSESAPSNTVRERTLDGTPPTKPDGLSGTAVSATQIDLTWLPSSDPETGILEYVVYRGGVEIGRSPTTTYSDTGLTASTMYQYRVSAVNGEGMEGSASNPVNVSTLDPAPPPPPTNLTATTLSASEIDLAWTASTGNDVTGYRVYRNGNPVADVTGTTYRDSGLQGFTTYNYTVTAFDSAGLESDPSNSAQATTLDATPPTRPANLTATATGTTTISLSWSGSADPETGVSSYLVYRDSVQVAQTTGTSYVDTGLSPATTYEYRVSAVNGEGLESALSNPASATTSDATGPSTPTNLTATTAGTDRIDLAWSSSSDPESGIDFYRIYRDGAPVAETPGTTHVDTGLSPFTTYEYRVSAINGQGVESALSDPASATTLDATPPTTPQNLAASPVGTERIDLSWTASDDPESGVSGYLVFRDGSQVGTTAQTTFQDGGLTPATLYQYHVVAVNGDGLQSQPSATASARTFDGTGPTAPTDLTATAAGTDRIDLTWSPAQDDESGISAYKIFRDGTEVGTTTDTSYQDSGLAPATTYEYRVSAVNGDGLQGNLSDPASATTLDGSGPTAPTGVEATPVSQTQIDLTWTASEDPESGVDQYKVYRGGTVVGTVVSTSFADTGLQQNTTYAYAISAVNADGIEGAKSQAVSARTFPSEDAIPPAPPTALRVVNP